MGNGKSVPALPLPTEGPAPAPTLPLPTEEPIPSVDNFILYVYKTVDSDGKVGFYIGRTKNFKIRDKEHREGKGANYTRGKTLTLFHEKQGSPFEEDALTLEYMHHYGIDNVRGGSWCNLIHTDADRTDIRRKIRTATFATKITLCNRCGRSNHSTANCYAGTHISGTVLKKEEQKSVARRCGRCRRPGHNRTKCNATHQEDGTPL